MPAPRIAEHRIRGSARDKAGDLSTEQPAAPLPTRPLS
jgi:hypothetical protein